MKRKIIGIFLLFACAAALLSAGDYELKNLKLNRPAGIYKCGEKVVVSGQLFKAKRPVAEGKLRVLVKWEHKQLEARDLPCDGKPFQLTFDKGDKPGWVYFGFQVIDKDGKVVEDPAAKAPQGKKKQVAEIGAIFEPEKIRSSYPIPEDFMEFWQAERAKLAKVPLDAKVEKIESPEAGIDLYTVRVETGTDHPVTAYMAIPTGAKPKSLPIYIVYQSHSSSDLIPRIAVRLAKRGAIGMNATWHGLPLGQPAEFYRKECRYFNGRIGLDQPADWRFHGMYLRVLRALDYLKTRPEWNGRDLIVEGGSLGGCETACAAALDPDVTMAVISVCGFCDFNGDLDGRRGGNNANHPGAKKEPARRVLSYHDAVSFMRFIKCETYFCTGFADEICAPSSVYAAYNNLPAATKKEMFTNVRTGHGGTTYNVAAGKRLKEFFGNILIQPVAR